jgi:prevent-host-death family protein
LTEIGAFEARDKLSWLLDRVEQGEEIIITRYGRPVARLISTNATDAEIDPSQAQAALERMRDRARQAVSGPSIGKPSRQTETHPLKTTRSESRPD